MGASAVPALCLLFPLCSGIFGERLPLRYYLSGGMVLSGLFTLLFGLGYFWDIHALWYFIVMQVRPALALAQVFGGVREVAWHGRTLQDTAAHGVGTETAGHTWLGQQGEGWFGSSSCSRLSHGNDANGSRAVPAGKQRIQTESFPKSLGAGGSCWVQLPERRGT